MKVLNLYACLGGNRLLWDNCEVTAIELDPELARMYQERFPNDKVIVADAHEFLLNNYMWYDFIWSSPPCPTHSRARYWGFGANGKDPVYPDMKLYQEIVFLDTHHKGKWIVENLIPYYEPLIPSTEIDRHLYWSNFTITKPSKIRKASVCQGTDEVNRLCEFHKVDKDFLNSYKGEQRKAKIVRNLVDYEVGKHIFDLARGIYEHNNREQGTLF